MSSRALRLLVSISLAALAASAETRPRYGGTLRVQAAAIPAIERSHLIAETLVRLGQDGEARGWLARTWQHDPDFKLWSFTLRSKVTFHDGTPLTADVAAPLLAEALKMECTAAGLVVTIRADQPQSDLLAKLGAPGAAILRRDAKGLASGTGPFRITANEPGRRIVLSAFEEYWGGRPYVDSVEITPARPVYQPSVADLWQLPVNIGRRSLPERIRVWTSEPRELIAISMPGVPPPLREAMALSIDRDSIVSVLMQRRGEPAWSLLPEWMTGYAFLFKSAPDPARVRQILAASGRIPPLTMSAPVDDPLARLVADRIIVNAREAGLTIAGVSHDGSVRVERVSLASNDGALALTGLAAAFGLRIPTPPVTIEALHEGERAMLEDRRVVPVVFIPDVYGISPRVRGWDHAQALRAGLLHLEDLWLEP